MNVQYSPTPFHVFGSGRHVGRPIELVVFKDPGLVFWCFEHSDGYSLQAVVGELIERATPDRVALQCPCGNGLAQRVDIPSGHDGLSVHGGRLVCSECQDRWEGYCRFELSLLGAFSFCAQEWRRCERQGFGKLLARAYGIRRITTEAAMKFFHQQQPS